MANDIIDFTMLQKKGILQRAMQKDESDKTNSKNEGSVVDFTANNSFAGFFGSVNSASSASAKSTSSAVESSDFGSLKLKLEDAEYKLERALERIDALERKIISISQVKS